MKPIESVKGGKDGTKRTSEIIRPSLSRPSRRTSMKSRLTMNKSYLINVEDFADTMVTIPPDGGWGWVVVLVSFISMFFIDGIAYCLAPFFLELSKDFKCEITEIAVVGALIGGFYYLSGPLSCAAINRYGFRPIAVIGGMLASITFIAASFLTSKMPFLILVGVLGGTSFNLMYSPTVVATGFYFERWRALAMAISCCGSSLGVMSLPMFWELVAKGYRWQTKFKYIGGIFFLCGLMGLAFKPIKAKKIEKVVQFGEVSRMPSSNTMDEIELPGGILGALYRFKNIFFPTISEVSMLSGSGGGTPVANRSAVTSRTSSYTYFLNRDLADDEQSAQVYLDSSSGYATRQSSMRASKEGSQRKIKCCSIKKRSLATINRPLYRDDIFYQGSISKLSNITAPSSVRPSRLGSFASVPGRTRESIAYTLSVSRAATQRDLNETYKCICCPEASLRVLVTMLHLEMLKSPTFVMICTSGYFSLMITYITFTYITLFAEQQGIEPEYGIMLLSVIGISNAVGRAVCGIVSCFPILDTNTVCWTTIFASGVCVILSVFFNTWLQLVILYGLFGFLLASFAVLRTLQFVEMFGLENLTNCFGLNMLFMSAAAFSGTPIANIILTYTNNDFVPVFIFVGVCTSVSGLMLIPIKMVLRWETRKKEKRAPNV
ncbi:uncharacterized protein LOC126736356 isoform X2 [Anthonomus grandis grandis]|uniref:uncharacterized protein LOC126736356 isoform X2 n=1 Tax=Anthonomus grandis grandis TaxID=2921223 RepID=UPI002165E22E|nr:uncharacterized protein LOC126736356 isoform X2 [Anthonomus grandis grandis]